MAEYISRAYALEVIKHISEDEPWQEACVNNVIRLLNELPSIDIVHCKNCKWAGRDDHCPAIEIYMICGENGYCSYGEREEQEHEEVL